jgi:putative transposase
VVHQIRHSLRLVSYKDRRAVAADLKKIYTATDRDHAETELEAFAAKWDHRYPMISASWMENWERIVPFLLFPPDARRVIYTTNTIEALNRQIRMTIKTRGHFPHQDAARKLLYLAITNAQTNWRSTYYTTGAPPSRPSESTSPTACPTTQADIHYLTATQQPLLRPQALTQQT